ncbi:MAG: biopolymer transporter ExbD [Nitrospinota bacterium]|nr:MAG: biopolymer transporter ExbD [Nitrospinota bacterium]
MEFTRRKRSEARVDLTPLIDVVLNLVIFLLLTTTFIVQPGLKVNLPQARTQEKTIEKKEWRVIITRDNRLFFNDRQITLAELGRAFQEVREQTEEEQTLVIKADKDVPHGRVVEVMDLAKQAGINRLAIATTPRLEE